MYENIVLKPPLFEIGLKGYLFGKDALELAKAADKISKKYGITIIFDPQHVDISKIAAETENIYVFAQHMDSIKIGVGVGSILPEAIKAAGAVGTLLNHSERRINLSEISKTIKRADEVGLATLVFADSPEEAAAIAHLNPNIILAEPPELIGSGTSVGKLQEEFISKTIAAVKKINPKIIIANSAGVRTADDVAEIIRLGAQATGSTSGILKSKDPIKTMEEMIKALKEAWLEIHPC
ncbi:MAG: triose-phosphate isomerase [Actinobacteria bacterium]|nr:triose-phosphate isomerase [Actinomycetota bacterium]